MFAFSTKVAWGGHAGCRKTRGKLEDACGLPLEAAFAFAAGADERRTAATRPACILTLWFFFTTISLPKKMEPHMSLQHV